MIDTYSLDNPLDGHRPMIGRRQSGKTWNNGRTYQTTIRCECGEKIGRGTFGTTASNVAPSKGGRTDAQRFYLAHIAKVLDR